MRKIQATILLLCFMLIICSCSNKNQNEQSDESVVLPQSITITNGKFVDAYGRHMILNGINLVNKNPAQNYIGNEGPETFSNFKKWGFNVIRLGIIWDGLEPEPSVYNEEYLRKIDKQIEMAKEQGLFVFLDMHQDLFSVKYSDGAPEWATLDEGKEHITGSVWSDAYLISPAVQTSWDNFWNNTAVSDGIGVQDHYANAWKQVAKRYVNNPTVIGFDILNEPFAGSDAKMYMPLLFEAYGELLFQETGEKHSIEDLAMMWADQKNRYEALKRLETKESFSKVMDAIYELNSRFERGPLQSFYQKVATAIREIDTKKILFFNHSYFCNSGVNTALEPVKLQNGQVDTLIAYAAHSYDLLIDTDNVTNSSRERLSLIHERINENGKRMNVPVLIGEWGGLGSDSNGCNELISMYHEFFEKYQFSNTYWAYSQGMQERSYFKNTIIRPYPICVSGELINYKYETTTGKFQYKWKENIGEDYPSCIYIPAIDLIAKKTITLLTKEYDLSIVPIEDSNAAYLIIPALGKNQEREIVFAIEKG